MISRRLCKISKPFLTIDDLFFVDADVIDIFDIIWIISVIFFHLVNVSCSGTFYADIYGVQ